jgi:hypothetical protein
MIIKSWSPRQQQLGDPHQDLHTEPKILGDTLTADLLSRKKKIARLLRDQNQLEKLAANRGQLQYPAWDLKANENCTLQTGSGNADQNKRRSLDMQIQERNGDRASWDGNRVLLVNR